MSQTFFGIDALMDSEDLMSWLLLNPELDNFASSYNIVNSVSTNPAPASNMYDFPTYNDMQAQVSFQTTNQLHGNVPIGVSSNNYSYESNNNNQPEQNSNKFYSSIETSGSNTSLNSTNRKASFDTTEDSVAGNHPPNQGVHSSAIPQYQHSNSNNQNDMSYPKKVSSFSSLAGASKSIAPSVAAVAASSSSKKRPRESIEDLENRVKELRAENEDLHTHYLNVTQRTTEVQKQRAEMEKMMDIKLSEIGDRNDGDQSELAKIVKQYTDLYADYGKCRQREVSFHLQQLEKLVVPTMTTKMCLWTLHQDPSFYQKNRSPMFNILCDELELTPEQIEKILEKRERTSTLLSKLRECLDLIQSLKTAIEKKDRKSVV